MIIIKKKKNPTESFKSATSCDLRSRCLKSPCQSVDGVHRAGSVMLRVNLRIEVPAPLIPLSSDFQLPLRCSEFLQWNADRDFICRTSRGGRLDDESLQIFSDIFHIKRNLEVSLCKGTNKPEQKNNQFHHVFWLWLGSVLRLTSSSSCAALRVC